MNAYLTCFRAIQAELPRIIVKIHKLLDKAPFNLTPDEVRTESIASMAAAASTSEDNPVCILFGALSLWRKTAAEKAQQIRRIEEQEAESVCFGVSFFSSGNSDK